MTWLLLFDCARPPDENKSGKDDGDDDKDVNLARLPPSI
jgi:hypothetical protein